MITNNWIDDTDSQTNQLMDQFLSRHFDVVLQSCRLGIRKPDPLIYRLACHRLIVQPSEVNIIMHTIRVSFRNMVRGRGKFPNEIRMPVLAMLNHMVKSRRIQGVTNPDNQTPQPSTGYVAVCVHLDWYVICYHTILAMNVCCHDSVFNCLQAVFLDDLGRNVRAAGEVGMVTVRVRETEKALREMERLLGVRLGMEGEGREMDNHQSKL